RRGKVSEIERGNRFGEERVVESENMSAEGLGADDERLLGVEETNVAIDIEAQGPAYHIRTVDIVLVTQERLAGQRIGPDLSVSWRDFSSYRWSKDLVGRGVEEKRLGIKIGELTPHHRIETRHAKAYGDAADLDLGKQHIGMKVIDQETIEKLLTSR